MWVGNFGSLCFPSELGDKVVQGTSLKSRVIVSEPCGQSEGHLTKSMHSGY